MPPGWTTDCCSPLRWSIWTGWGSRIHNLSLSATATGNIPTCIFSSTAWATTDERSPTATIATVLERLCKQLTARYGLYFASGKEQVKEYRLREPDKTKYEIYHALCDAVPRCRNWEELTAALRREGIATEFRMRGGTSDVQGVVFAKNGYPFNGSKIDRQFSYSKIDTALERNNRQALAPERQSAPTLTPSFSYLLDDLLRPRLIPTRRNKPSRSNSADAAGDDVKLNTISPIDNPIRVLPTIEGRINLLDSVFIEVK